LTNLGWETVWGRWLGYISGVEVERLPEPQRYWGFLLLHTIVEALRVRG
jgi:hypothetical protein